MQIAVFIAGMAAGMALHRLIMFLVLDASPDNICAYCEWMERKRSRHSK